MLTSFCNTWMVPVAALWILNVTEFCYLTVHQWNSVTELLLRWIILLLLRWILVLKHSAFCYWILSRNNTMCDYHFLSGSGSACDYHFFIKRSTDETCRIIWKQVMFGDYQLQKEHISVWGFDSENSNTTCSLEYSEIQLTACLVSICTI